jgi:hypothetical protein
MQMIFPCFSHLREKCRIEPPEKLKKLLSFLDTLVASALLHGDVGAEIR